MVFMIWYKTDYKNSKNALKIAKKNKLTKKSKLILWRVKCRNFSPLQKGKGKLHSSYFKICTGDTIQTGTGKVDPARKFKCTTTARDNGWLIEITVKALFQILQTIKYIHKIYD